MLLPDPLTSSCSSFEVEKTDITKDITSLLVLEDTDQEVECVR